VGMNRIFKESSFKDSSIPHRRGDEPRYYVIKYPALEYSPQAWG